MADIKDWMATAKPDPEWEAAVQAMGGQAPDLGMFPSIQAMRQWIIESKKAAAAAMGPGIEGVKMTDHQIPTRDGSTITCRVHALANKSGGAPLAIIFHGGGWCIGGLENEEMLCNRLAKELGIVCMNVDYRLAPEHKFPAAVHDCHDATKWAALNAASIGVDLTKGFIMGGTSAGGNLTTIVSHLVRDEGMSPPLTGCLLMIPAVCYHTALPEKYKPDFGSWEQNKDAPILSRNACSLFMDNYIPDEKDRNGPLYSAFTWESGHGNLPPHVLQICGMDPLRDEALIYERVLREDEGIKTKALMYPGLPHGFWSIIPSMKASQKFVDDSVSSVKWLLEQ